MSAVVQAIVKFKAELVEVEEMECCEICEGDLLTKGWEIRASCGSQYEPVFFICTGCISKDDLKAFLR